MPPSRMSITVRLSVEHLMFLEHCAKAHTFVFRDDVLECAIDHFRRYIDAVAAHIRAEEAKGRTQADIMKGLACDFVFRAQPDTMPSSICKHTGHD